MAEPVILNDINGKARTIRVTCYKDGIRNMVANDVDKRTCVAEPVGVAQCGRYSEDGSTYQHIEACSDNKANALTTVQKDSMVAEPVNATKTGKSQTIKAQYSNSSIANFCCYTSTYGATGVAEPVAPDRVGCMPSPDGTIRNGQAMRVYSVDGKSVNLTANGGGAGGKTGLYAIPVGIAEPIEWNEYGEPVMAVSGTTGKAYTVYKVENGQIAIKGKSYPIKLADGYYIIRKLTPTECERLQTLPVGYTSAGGQMKNTNRYKAIGNGWTAEVIIHLLNHALKDVPRDEEIVVLSMYDGIATGRYCLDKIGFTNVTYHAYEIDKNAIEIATYNYPDIIEHGDAFQVREKKNVLSL